MKTYLDIDEILCHCRRYIGQEYDEPYLVSAIPEEVIRSLTPADVVEVRHGHFGKHTSPFTAPCSECGTSMNMHWHYCPSCGARMSGGTEECD